MTRRQPRGTPMRAASRSTSAGLRPIPNWRARSSWRRRSWRRSSRGLRPPQRRRPRRGGLGTPSSFTPATKTCRWGPRVSYMMPLASRQNVECRRVGNMRRHSRLEPQLYVFLGVFLRRKGSGIPLCVLCVRFSCVYWPVHCYAVQRRWPRIPHPPRGSSIRLTRAN